MHGLLNVKNMCPFLISFLQSGLLNVDSEVHSSKGDRPRKRKGGGGYGHFNTLNSSKNMQKNKVYRQPKKRPGDRRQFSR